jgi:hypothetical protein
LRLGLSLADLEKLNRKPFKLRGFDKDNTATVSDWDHGALPRSRGAARPVSFWVPKPKRRHRFSPSCLLIANFPPPMRRCAP